MDGSVRYSRSKRSETSLGSSTPVPPSSRRASRTTSNVSTVSSAIGTDVASLVGLISSRGPVMLPKAASQVTKARRIRFYRNGDTYYEGMVLVLASENFRTFDSLLTYLNKTQLADPSVLKKVSRPL